MVDRILTTSELRIDLNRVRQNYRRLLAYLVSVPAAAMVKANGYGLGAVEVAQALATDGCSTFFVANVEEGAELRQALPLAEIRVLNGSMPGTETDLLEHRLTPVLNSLEQISRWRQRARSQDQRLPAVIHLDTGMSRLGLPPDEAAALCADLSLLDGLDIEHVMSHLASADVPGSSQTAQQLTAFRSLRDRLPFGSASLANSSGIFLGPDFHFDLVRPGIALYGGNPTPGRPNPMTSVVTLEAPVLQVRAVDAGEAIGYGATHVMTTPGRIATIAVGYADGFLRSGSGRGFAAIAGRQVPIVGRISMDLVTLDVTGVPLCDLYLGAPVELIGDHCLVDEVATRAGTIANELLTDLGRRYRVRHLGPQPVDLGRVDPGQT